MKFVIVFLMLTSLGVAQQYPDVNNCGSSKARPWQDYEAYDYQKSVVRLLNTEDRPLVSLSVFVTGNAPKFFIRLKAPGQFEILRAMPQENLSNLLNYLQSSCKLPFSPREAVKLVNARWERKSISEDEFQRIYTGFSTALKQYLSNVEQRPRKKGDRITVDSPEFSILYDTAGYENFEITAMDSRDETGNPDDPMAKWAKGFIADVEHIFNSNPR